MFKSQKDCYLQKKFHTPEINDLGSVDYTNFVLQPSYTSEIFEEYDSALDTAIDLEDERTISKLSCRMDNLGYLVDNRLITDVELSQSKDIDSEIPRLVDSIAALNTIHQEARNLYTEGMSVNDFKKGLISIINDNRACRELTYDKDGHMKFHNRYNSTVVLKKLKDSIARDNLIDIPKKLFKNINITSEAFIDTASKLVRSCCDTMKISSKKAMDILNIDSYFKAKVNEKVNDMQKTASKSR